MPTIAWWEVVSLDPCDGDLRDRPVLSVCLGCAIRVNQEEFVLTYVEAEAADVGIEDGLDCEVCGTNVVPPIKPPTDAR